jgi:amino acid adenylation domain-containing protein
MSELQQLANAVTNQSRFSADSKVQFVSVAQQIAEVAARSPESIAVVSGCRQITFRDLVARAAALADKLAAACGDRGTGPIVVCTGDSLLMIICAMAAWQTGRSYLPVSPSGPVERLRHILAEAQPVVIAASKGELAVLPIGDWQLLAVDEYASPEFAATGAGQSFAAVSAIQPDSLAYVIYTSGSTGQPKGACVTQANLAHLVQWYSSAFDVRPGSRASQFAALTFDAAVLEIWTNLAGGATLFVPDSLVPLVPEHLRDYLVEQKIARCFAATAIAEQLLTLNWPGKTKLQYLLTGADTLRVFPPSGLPFQVVNNYGPTECTVLATSGVVPPSAEGQGLPAIGRPIPGARIYIVDSNLKLASDGQRGEICIGGAIVGLGYIGRPDLTAERFVPDPFLAEPSRMYRTGDIGRKLPDGQFEFLGRLDHQINLRGYRIEPGEIVSALRSHPSIRAAAVKSIGADSEKHIAAYLILKSSVSASDLRDHLSSRLPEYMIPDHLVRLDELPFNASGKVDLTLLPLPDSENSLPREESALGPETEIQEEITSILSALLGGRPVGLQDNFFRLGGHSLLAAQVITRVRSAFGVELSLRTVFESPTVAGLSVAIEEKILAQLAASSIDDSPESPGHDRQLN